MRVSKVDWLSEHWGLSRMSVCDGGEGADGDDGGFGVEGDDEGGGCF